MFGQYFGHPYYGDPYFGPTSGGAPPVTPAPPPDGPHGPGWKLFGERAAHPVSKRKKKVEDVEADLVRAFEDATGITAERERLEAVREIKRAAATALSVATKEQDEGLREIAQQIIGLRKFELTLADYLARVGEILSRIEAVAREQEEDDLEALMLMARLV